jgi:2-dehydropantoate 2-reductase
MNICFFGVGGVGGYFGALLTKKFKNEHDIYFIARGKHKDAIRLNGLILKKEGGEELITVSPKLCTDTLEQVPICDIVFLSVKAYDLSNASKEISKIVNDKTIILPLLNGVDIYERIRAHLKTGIVLPSCVYVGTHIESPGVIYQKGGSCKISLGYDPDFMEFYPTSLLSLLESSEIDFTWEDNVKIPIWSKFMFIAAYGLVTATYEKTLGEIMEDSELARLTKSIMREIEEIAKGLKISLNSNIVEESFLKAKQFPYETKTSFQRDVELKGKVNEGDVFGGALIRYGQLLGLPTPNIKTTYEKLLSKFEKMPVST